MQTCTYHMIVYKGQGIDWHPQSDSLGVSPLKWTRSTLTLISGLCCLLESLRQLICFIGCFTFDLISLTLPNMSFLSSSLFSSLLSLPGNFPTCTRSVQPSCLPISYACILYTTILANLILMYKIEEMPPFIEDTISQELVHETTNKASQLP